MIAVALKGLLGRKTRAILTALAIVLGTGMVSATFIFTDTLNKAFDGVFSSSYKQTSVVVSGKQIVTGAATAPTVPASLLARIKAVPGVEAASGGFLFETVKLVGADGKTIDANGAPQFGFGIDPSDKRFNPLALTAGSWPSGPDQIAIGAATAAAEHYAVGDTIQAKGNTGPARRYTISGLVQMPGVSLGSATIAMFDVATAQALLGKEGRYGSISVIATPDVTPQRLAARIRPLLSADADGADLGRSGQLRQQGCDGRDGRPALHPARLRRDRTVRRRVRHLQHHLDDGRPADTRVRDAPHPRRLAAAGAPLGAPRERRDRRPRLACSGWGSASSCSRPGHAVQGPSPGRHSHLTPDDRRHDGCRYRRHASGRSLPGAPGDAGRADLRRPRRRRRCPWDVSPATSRTSQSP